MYANMYALFDVHKSKSILSATFSFWAKYTKWRCCLFVPDGMKVKVFCVKSHFLQINRWPSSRPRRFFCSPATVALFDRRHTTAVPVTHKVLFARSYHRWVTLYNEHTLFVVIDVFVNWFVKRDCYLFIDYYITSDGFGVKPPHPTRTWNQWTKVTACRWSAVCITAGSMRSQWFIGYWPTCY